MHAPRLANTPASRSSQTAQATPKGLLRLARAFGVRTRWQIIIAPMDPVARNTLILGELLRVDAPLKEAAEKVPLYMLISCNYILIVAGFFVPLSY